MLLIKGVATEEDLNKVLPTEERMSQGPVAVFECFQEIPCNPCESSCFRGAVNIGEDINTIPQVDHNICNGCSSCVGACPGLAVFIVDKSGSGDTGKLTIPYEFSPLPNEGDMVLGLDRSGIPVAECEVVKVRNNQRLDRTALITVELSKEKINLVRFIKVKG